MTRHLVTVVPTGAAVQVSSVDPLTDAGTGLHYADHDLKRDLLIHCHDNGDHPSVFTTNGNVRALAWFPNMRNYIQDHCDSCAYCLAKRKATPPVGDAVRCRRRLKLVEFDHKILSKDVVTTTGYAAVLTVVDVVMRVTVFVPVTAVDAVTTARALFTRWYPLFGMPAVFRMDGAPAFSSDVMHAFYSIMGVKHVDVSAPDNPTHHSTVERRIVVIKKNY